jgi:hypothetical protein
MPLFLSLVSLIIAFKLNKQLLSSILLVEQLKVYFESCKWFYNEFVNTYLALPTLNAGRTMFEQYEKRVLELHGPTLLVESVSKTYNIENT